MLDLSLVSSNHVRRYSITLAGEEGWEVRLEEDRVLRKRETYKDWHRVEQMRTKVEREVSSLLEHGWTLQAVSR
ncbi:MAG: hypothetical protein AB7Q29_05440 [Vicinamibacterales bacterium]